MPIQVTCPGCFTRFQVHEKHAGKKGPCPKCKKEITIPDAKEQVVVHAPEDAGPKDSQGRSVLKPIARSDARVTTRGLVLVVGAIGLSIAAAIGLRFAGEVPLILRVFAVVLAAPALIFSGYTFARDQELEPYRGNELLIRLAITSAIMAALWGIYAFVPAYLLELDKPSEASYIAMGVALAVMIGLGSLAAVATFELEFGGGFVVAALYFISVVLLAVIAGIPLAGAAAGLVPQ